MKSMSTFALLSLVLVGCSGADFNVGATRGDTGDLSETSDDTGELDAENDSGAEAQAETSVETDSDSGPVDTGTPPTDSGIDTGSDSGPVDTGTPPTDSGSEVVCPDSDGDGQKAAWCGGTDCHDGNKDVFFGQTKTFGEPYLLPGGGSSWDYNCNGVVDHWMTTIGSCKNVSGVCKNTFGWAGPAVPPCGTIAPVISSCTDGAGGTCSVPADTRKQWCN